MKLLHRLLLLLVLVLLLAGATMGQHAQAADELSMHYAQAADELSMHYAQAADEPSMQSILEMISSSYCNNDNFPPSFIQDPPLYTVGCAVTMDNSFSVTFREFTTPELAADAFSALAASVVPGNTDDFHGLRQVLYAKEVSNDAWTHSPHMTWLTGRWLIEVYTFDRGNIRSVQSFAETTYEATVRYRLLELETSPLERILRQLAPAYCASSPPVFDLDAPTSQFTCAPQPNAALAVGAEEYPDIAAAQTALATPPLGAPPAAQDDLLYRWRMERWVFWLRGDQAGWSEAQLDALRAHYSALLAASGLPRLAASEEYSTLALLAPDLCASAILFQLAQPRYALTCVQPNGLPLRLALHYDPQTDAAYALFHYRRQSAALQPFHGLPSFERAQTAGTEQVFSWVMGRWNIELVTDPSDDAAALAETVFAGIERSTLMPPLALAVVTGGLAQCPLDVTPKFSMYATSFEPHYAVECMLDANTQLEVAITRYQSPTLADNSYPRGNTEFHGLSAFRDSSIFPTDSHYWETLIWASGVVLVRVSLSSPEQTNLLLPAAETMYQALDRSGLLRLQGMFFLLFRR